MSHRPAIFKTHALALLVASAAYVLGVIAECWKPSVDTKPLCPVRPTLDTERISFRAWLFIPMF